MDRLVYSVGSSYWYDYAFSGSTLVVWVVGNSCCGNGSVIVGNDW